jgi:hypothetical protein
MTKYFAQRISGCERMSKSKFEKRFEDKIANSKFDKLTDIVNTRINEAINLYLNSTNKSFDYVVEKDGHVYTGFNKDSECFGIDNMSYHINNDYHSYNSNRFSLSMDYDMENDNNILLIFYNTSGSVWYNCDHVGAVIDRKLSRRSFNNIVKNLVKYFFALYVQDEEDLSGLDGLDSMEVQNVINLTSIDSLP